MVVQQEMMAAKVLMGRTIQKRFIQQTIIIEAQVPIK